MRSLKFKWILIVVVIFLLNIIGCRINNKDTSIDDSQKGIIVNNKIQQDPQDNGDNKSDADNIQNNNMQKSNEKRITDDINDGKTDTVLLEKVEQKVSKEAIKSKETRETVEFPKYDNNKKSWWFRKQKDNKPSTVNADIEDLIRKHEGIYIHHTEEKVVYLTFDEGYENGYTPKILDVLKEKNVKAAFFITGPYLKKHSNLVQRMLSEGHIVGNHTVNHPGMPDVTDDGKLEEEILGLERPFYEMFRQKMKYLRPPKGEYSERTLAITKSLGYKTVFWSFAYTDWDVNNQKGEDFAYDTVMSGIHNGAVLLLHAVSKDNANALERIINDARGRGYVFKTLSEMR